MYKIIEGEQRTDDWHERRAGKITGSIAKQVKGTGNAFMYETLAVMTTNRPPKQEKKGIADIERGIELEPEARAAYEKEKKCVVWTVAYIDAGRIGFSPDGLIRKKKLVAGGGMIEKIIEIKCPDLNNHIRYILEKKVPAEHYDQIIHAFVTCDDVDEIDFVSYCPAFQFKPLLIITVRRIDVYVDIQTTKITYDKFIKKIDENYAALIL